MLVLASSKSLIARDAISTSATTPRASNLLRAPLAERRHTICESNGDLHQLTGMDFAATFDCTKRSVGIA
jgi:hypothetical protein